MVGLCSHIQDRLDGRMTRTLGYQITMEKTIVAVSHKPFTRSSNLEFVTEPVVRASIAICVLLPLFMQVSLAPDHVPPEATDPSLAQTTARTANLLVVMVSQNKLASSKMPLDVLFSFLGLYKAPQRMALSLTWVSFYALHTCWSVPSLVV